MMKQKHSRFFYNDLMCECEWEAIYLLVDTESMHSLLNTSKQPISAPDLEPMVPLATPDILHKSRCSLLL